MRQGRSEFVRCRDREIADAAGRAIGVAGSNDDRVDQRSQCLAMAGRDPKRSNHPDRDIFVAGAAVEQEAVERQQEGRQADIARRGGQADLPQSSPVEHDAPHVDGGLVRRILVPAAGQDERRRWRCEPLFPIFEICQGLPSAEVGFLFADQEVDRVQVRHLRRRHGRPLKGSGEPFGEGRYRPAVANQMMESQHENKLRRVPPIKHGAPESCALHLERQARSGHDLFRRIGGGEVDGLQGHFPCLVQNAHRPSVGRDEARAQQRVLPR